jgi:predicted amidohydrolase YtcJ
VLPLLKEAAIKAVNAAKENAKKETEAAAAIAAAKEGVAQGIEEVKTEAAAAGGATEAKGDGKPAAAAAAPRIEKPMEVRVRAGSMHSLRTQRTQRLATPASHVLPRVLLACR